MPETKPLNLDEVEARIERHRCRTDSPQRGDANFVDLSRLIDQDAPALAAKVRELSAYIARITDAAEDALAEAERAETDAVMDGADPEFCLLPALKGVRAAVLDVPTDALKFAKAVAS